MKKKTLGLIKLIVKYILPAILGWIEGDSQLFSDSISDLISVIL